MNNSARPHGPRPQAFRSGGSAAAEKAARNILPAKIPRNPLKSLDSDERIQGNPSFSNPQNRGYLQRNGQEPRKPKRDRLDSQRGPLPRRGQTGSIQMQSACAGAATACARVPIALDWTADCLRLPVARQGGMSRLKRLSLRAQFLRLHPASACGSPVAPLR
jgi:hypothetical protein